MDECLVMRFGCVLLACNMDERIAQVSVHEVEEPVLLYLTSFLDIKGMLQDKIMLKNK